MKLRNGTLVDGILDVNPTATSIIAQHNASTPLLKLPLEVKNLIYEYTLAGHLIHITQNHGGGGVKFKSTVCSALLSEEEAQDNFDSENTHQWYAPANEGRHDCCRLISIAMRARPNTEVVDLGLLRSCRQVYNDAHFIPYSTNTFSCTDPETLQDFVLSIAQGNKSNHLAIRSLFLEMVYDTRQLRRLWKEAVSTCVRKLGALRKVSITVDWRDWRPLVFRSLVSPMHGDLTRGRKCWRDNLVSTISAFKRLPLKTATMVISDKVAEEVAHRSGPPAFWATHEHEYRLSLDEKRKCVCYIREHILQPNR